MKELVPEYNNSKSTLESIIYDLKKYTDSDDLIVGIKLNRNARIDFSSIKILFRYRWRKFTVLVQRGLTRAVGSLLGMFLVNVVGGNMSFPASSLDFALWHPGYLLCSGTRCIPIDTCDVGLPADKSTLRVPPLFTAYYKC